MEHSPVKRLYQGKGYLKSSRCRGTTLMEMIIVMGVIGIILAGVFVTVSAVRYRIEVNQGVDEINMIVGNMRSLYAAQNASQAAVVLFGAPLLVQQGVFPSEMLVPGLPPSGIPAAGTVANNPWDQSTANGSAQIQVNNPTAGQFILSYLKIPAEVCADLLVRNSSPGTDTGLQQIQVNGVNVGPLPVTPLAAATACVVGATYTINWVYTLGS